MTNQQTLTLDPNDLYSKLARPFNYYSHKNTNHILDPSTSSLGLGLGLVLGLVLELGLVLP